MSGVLPYVHPMPKLKVAIVEENKGKGDMKRKEWCKKGKIKGCGRYSHMKKIEQRKKKLC